LILIEKWNINLLISFRDDSIVDEGTSAEDVDNNEFKAQWIMSFNHNDGLHFRGEGI